MSQKKVDYYKAGKNSRSKTARREKLIDRLEILAWIVIAVAMVGWIGYSAYVKITATDSSTTLSTTFDDSALSNYISALSEEETETDTAEAEDTEETDTDETVEAAEEPDEAAETSEETTDASETETDTAAESTSAADAE